MPPVEGVAGGGTAYGWNDGVLHDANPLKGSIDPTKVPTSDLVHVWCMPSTANVGLQEMPRHLEPVSIVVMYYVLCFHVTTFLLSVVFHLIDVEIFHLIQCVFLVIV